MSNAAVPERRQHILRVMGQRGDVATRWETGADVETDPEAQAAIREAEQIFRAAQARGDTAFIVAPGKKPERLDTWDQRALEAPEIVITPRLVGG